MFDQKIFHGQPFQVSGKDEQLHQHSSCQHLTIYGATDKVSFGARCGCAMAVSEEDALLVALLRVKLQHEKNDL